MGIQSNPSPERILRLFPQFDPFTYNTDVNAATSRAVDTIKWSHALLVVDADSVSTDPVEVLLQSAATQTGSYTDIPGSTITLPISSNAVLGYGILRLGTQLNERWIRARIQASGSTLVGGCFIQAMNPHYEADIDDSVSPLFNIGVGE